MFLNLVFYDPRRFNSVHFTHPHITPEEVVGHVIQLQLKFEVLRFCRSELLTQTVRVSCQVCWFWETRTWCIWQLFQQDCIDDGGCRLEVLQLCLLTHTGYDLCCHLGADLPVVVVLLLSQDVLATSFNYGCSTGVSLIKQKNKNELDGHSTEA